MSPPLKKGEKMGVHISDEILRLLKYTEKVCGVETANTVEIQSRPPLLMQRECNGESPANAGRMQEKSLF